MSRCGEQASPHLVIDLVIQAAGPRLPEGSPRQVSGAGVMKGRSGPVAMGPRQQVEFGGPADERDLLSALESNRLLTSGNRRDRQ